MPLKGRRHVAEPCCLIEARPGWEVCAEAADGATALEMTRRQKPDVAVIDVSLPVMNGLAVARALTQEHPGLGVLLFTVHADDRTVSVALAAGVRGYVLKTECLQHLEAAIAALGAKRPYLYSWVSEILLRAAVQRSNNKANEKSRIESFTRRELEVVQLIP